MRSPRCPSRSQGLPTRCQSAFLATTGMLASLVSTVVLYVELVVCRVGAETRLGSWVMARRPTRLSRSTLLASPTQRRLQQAAFTCAVSRSGSIKCWGSGAWGKLGIDDGNDHSTPVEVIGVSGATDLSAGSFYSCAIADGGMAMCWGMATFGQVGDGRNYSPFDPYRFVSPPKTVVGPVVTAGSGIAASPDPVYGTSAVGHSCAVRAGASVACWGINLSGELGVSSPSEVASMPVEVSGVSGVTDVVTGGSHSCALMSAEVRCWGNNTFGQLGAGPGLPWGPNPTPLTVKGL